MSCSLSYANQLPFFSKRASTNLLFPNFTTSSLQLVSDKPCRRRLRALLSIQEIPPNALRRKNDPLWRGGFSLGVDLGLSRSGVALSKGFTVRPLTVLLPYILSISFLKIQSFINVMFRFWNCEDKSLSFDFLKLQKTRQKSLVFLS